MSEITRADYRAITDAAYDLSLLIHGFMDRMEDGAMDPAWHELHELSQLAHVTATAAGRYADRAGLPGEPVDYRPAAPAPDGCTCGGIGATGSHRPDCIWAWKPVDYRPADEAYRKRLEYGLPDCAPFASER